MYIKPFFSLFFFSLVPLQRKQLQVLHLFLSSTILTKLWQKMIMNAMFIDVFCFSYEIKAEDNNEHTLSFFLANS